MLKAALNSGKVSTSDQRAVLGKDGGSGVGSGVGSGGCSGGGSGGGWQGRCHCGGGGVLGVEW